MLNRHHVVIGACGVALGTAVGMVPWEVPKVAVLASGLVLAGSVRPDIDHRSSHITKAWGPVSWVECRIWRGLHRVVYAQTRARDDPKKRDPHRGLTHTIPGALLMGIVTAAVMVIGPVAAALVVAYLFGVAGRCWDRDMQPWAAVFGAVVAYQSWAVIPEAWPVWTLATAAGCVLHTGSDCVSRYGGPLWFPILVRSVKTAKDGTKRAVQRRWHMVKPPALLAYETDSMRETIYLRLLVGLTIAVVWLLIR